MELKHPNRDDRERDIALLIVPYGIETFPATSGSARDLLLIVPYGIETGCRCRYNTRLQAFNRTLWN